MRIYVTKDDIKKGVPGSSGQCPIARSLQRRFGPFDFVSVGPRGGLVGTRFFGLPERAQKFVSGFDRRPTRQKPFHFTLKFL